MNSIFYLLGEYRFRRQFLRRQHFFLLQYWEKSAFFLVPSLEPLHPDSIFADSIFDQNLSTKGYGCQDYAAGKKLNKKPLSYCIRINPRVGVRNGTSEMEALISSFNEMWASIFLFSDLFAQTIPDCYCAIEFRTIVRVIVPTLTIKRYSIQNG